MEFIQVIRTLDRISDLIDHKNKLIMGWTPKAGCTTSVMMFFEHMGLLEESLKIDGWSHTYREQIFKHQYPCYKENLFEPSYRLFKVVRCPYARAVSSFIHSSKFGLCPAGLSFTSFLQWVKEEKHIEESASHYLPQITGFEDVEKGQYRIIKIEQFEQDVLKMNKEWGCSFNPYQKIIQSDHYIEKNVALTGNYSKVPFPELPVPFPRYSFFYGDKEQIAVQRYYDLDLLYYGYKFEDFMAKNLYKQWLI